MAARIDAGRGSLTPPRSGGVAVRGARGGEAAGELGRTLSNFADGQLNEIRQERAADQAAADRIQVAQVSSALRLDWQKRLQDTLDGYDGAEPGFAETVAEQYREDVRTRLEAMPSRLRSAVELDAVQFGERLTSYAIDGEKGKRQSYVMGGLRRTLDAEATALLEQPEDLGAALEGVSRLAEAAPEGLRSDFTDEARTALTAAYVDGLMATDPSRLSYELEAGLLDSVLDAPERAALEKTVNGEVGRLARQAEQQRAREEKLAMTQAKDLVARVIAYENAGLAAPAELVQAARDAAISVGNAAALEKMELASYKRRTKGRRGAGSSSLDILEKTLESGLTPGPEMIAQARAEVEASGSDALLQRLTGIAETQELRQQAAFMPRADLDARLAELRAGETDEAALREFTVLSKVAGQRSRRGDDDNIGWAQANGAQFQPLDLGADSLAGDLALRVIQAEQLAEASGEPFQVFSKSERGRLSSALAALPAEDQAMTLARLTAGAGGRSGAVVRELAEKDPAFGQAGYLTATGRGGVAVEALRGAKLLKERNDLLPKGRTAYEGAESDVLGTAIPSSREDVRAGIISTARALYASRLAAEGKTAEDFDADDYAEALQDAAGRQSTGGGIGKVNRSRVLLPAHMRAGDVQGLVRSVSIEDWTAFSMDGQTVPSIRTADGYAPVDIGRLKKAELVSVGEGIYQVSLSDPALGRAYVLNPANGRPFVLDLRQVDPGVVLQRVSSDEALRRAHAKPDDEPMSHGRDHPLYQEYLRREAERRE